MPPPARTWHNRRGCRGYDVPISLRRQPNRHSPPNPGGRARSSVAERKGCRKRVARRRSLRGAGRSKTPTAMARQSRLASLRRVWWPSAGFLTRVPIAVDVLDCLCLQFEQLRASLSGNSSLLGRLARSRVAAKAILISALAICVPRISMLARRISSRARHHNTVNAITRPTITTATIIVRTRNRMFSLRRGMILSIMITPVGRRIDHQPHHATIGAQILVGIGRGWGRVVIRQGPLCRA